MKIQDPKSETDRAGKADEKKELFVQFPYIPPELQSLNLQKKKKN